MDNFKIFLSILTFIFLLSCSNNKNTNSSSSAPHIPEKHDTTTADTNKDNFPLIRKLIYLAPQDYPASNTDSLLNAFLQLLASNTYTTQELKELDSLQNYIAALTDDAINEVTDLPDPDSLEQELKKLGLRSVYIKGQFSGIDYDLYPGNIMDKFPQDYQYYLKIRKNFFQAYTSNFPYLDNLHYFYDVLLLGEKMLKDYPDSYFTKTVRENFLKPAYRIFSDIHKVTDSGQPYFATGQFNRDYYGYAVDTGAIKEFMRKYPDFKANKAFEKILALPSEIPALNDSSPNPLLYLVVDTNFTNPATAYYWVFNYVRNGTDIPHVLPIMLQTGQVYYYTVYRFFPDKEKATQALEDFQKSNQEGYILQIKIYETDSTVGVEF